MCDLKCPYKRWIWQWWRYWFSPSTYIHWIYSLYQRATRGWADCDVWDLGNYLSLWLPDAIKRLRETTNGYPCGLSEQEWEHKLKEIENSFRAAKAINDGPPEDCFEWNEHKMPTRYIVERGRDWEEQQHNIFNRGIKTFSEYFFSLWD